VNRREGYRWSPRIWQPSDVQARILDAVSRGRTNAEIARELGMTVDGVKWHVSRALSETGLSDRQSLARWWQGGPLRMSLIEGNAHEAPRGSAGTGLLDFRPSMLLMAATHGMPRASIPSWRLLEWDERALVSGDQPEDKPV
jgi:DNA-binding CsgD family transcriptional regulator